MRLISVLLMGLLLAGCASGAFKVPKDEYRTKVKTLGVLPIIVDTESAINHSRRAGVVALLERTALGKLEASIEKLRKKKGYFDVRYLGENPRQLYNQLIVGRLPAGDSGLPGGYHFSATATSRLTSQKVVDGLLVVVLAGVEHEEKRRSRNKLETLTTTYNDIMATAVVIDSAGRVLWEMVGEQTHNLLALQYPDFDEAYFNKTDEVALKEITLEGLERTLTVPQEEGQPPRMAPAYQGLIDKIVSSLSPGLFGG